MSFYFFLGIIPLLVAGGLLIGVVVDATGADALVQPLYRVMPRGAADLLRHELHDIAATRDTSIAPLSLLGFLWLTTNGIHNLMDVFELLVGARPRPWWRQRLIALGWVFALILVFILATWLLLAANGAFQEVQGATQMPKLLYRVRELLEFGWNRAGVLTIFVGIFGAGLAAFYRIAVVHPPGVRRHVWPGTLIAITLWTVVSWAFGTYVRTIGDYAVYYGSLATVAVLLLWLYLTSLSLLVGAEANAQLEGIRESPHSLR